MRRTSLTVNPEIEKRQTEHDYHANDKQDAYRRLIGGRWIFCKPEINNTVCQVMVSIELHVVVQSNITA